MVSLGRLEEIKNLREVWKDEAKDFTPWLSEDDNISLLSDAIGIDITVEERESDVGAFHVDLFARESGTDRRIIIENQIEDTNHTHLGQLITYAAGKSAEIIIWIVKRARDEHRAAIEWLNNHTDDEIGFFLCELKLYKIDDSHPAVKFEVIEEPNNWSKSLNSAGNQYSQEHLEYWESFTDYASSKDIFSDFSCYKAHGRNYQDIKCEPRTFIFNVVRETKKGELKVGFYTHNREVYDRIYENKEAVEANLDFMIEWHDTPNTKHRKFYTKKSVDFSNIKDRERQFDWIIEVILKMREAMDPFII